MSVVLWIVGLGLLGTWIFTALLVRRFLQVIQKRRALIAALGGSGRAVPFFRNTLVMTYILFSIIWPVGLVWYFFAIVE